MAEYTFSDTHLELSQDISVLFCNSVPPTQSSMHDKQNSDFTFARTLCRGEERVARQLGTISHAQNMLSVSRQRDDLFENQSWSTAEALTHDSY